MWGLLLTTIMTSAADCLNPIGITQQFVLQGLVKKPSHIWYFIWPTGITNMITGYLAYYGLLTVLRRPVGALVARYGQVLYTAELILGIVFLVGVGYLLQGYKTKALQRQVQALQAGGIEGQSDEAQTAQKIRSVTPAALVALGIGATISELTSALPYFAFLAILFTYRLSVLQVTLILIVYNFIYMSPLMAMYFLYIKAQDKFDRLYVLLKAQMTKWSHVLSPVVAGLIGVALVYHSVAGLVGR